MSLDILLPILLGYTVLDVPADPAPMHANLGRIRFVFPCCHPEPVEESWQRRKENIQPHTDCSAKILRLRTSCSAQDDKFRELLTPNS